jgi:hypothetical protein
MTSRRPVCSVFPRTSLLPAVLLATFVASARAQTVIDFESLTKAPCSFNLTTALGEQLAPLGVHFSGPTTVDAERCSISAGTSSWTAQRREVPDVQPERDQLLERRSPDRSREPELRCARVPARDLVREHLGGDVSDRRVRRQRARRLELDQHGLGVDAAVDLRRGRVHGAS